MELLVQLDLIGPETLPLLLLAAGLLLSMAEAVAPGANFIVVGIALLGAGLVGLVLGPLASPFLLGLLILVFGAVAFYGYHELDLYGGKGQQQTRDSGTLKGETGRVTERVTPTEGEVKLDAGGFNPYYSARSLDGEIEEGTEVMVVDPGGGNVVTVESLGVVEDDIDRELAADRERSARAAETEQSGEPEREADRDAERETGSGGV
ncbi:NfeD family protein [Haloparvum sedimenti]|uniref:NfeD family protein n=1 Tax=Haloparvum sedimenti TaxID=1678448 RepID=UPI00071E8D94|nr:NfeD family protein [Haloparvum sedimenti]